MENVASVLHVFFSFSDKKPIDFDDYCPLLSTTNR